MFTGTDPRSSEEADMTLDLDPRCPQQLSLEEEIEACNKNEKVQAVVVELKNCEASIKGMYGSLKNASPEAKKDLRRINSKLCASRYRAKKKALSRKRDEYHRTRSDRDIKAQLMGVEPAEVCMPPRVIPETTEALLWDETGPMIRFLEAIERQMTVKIVQYKIVQYNVE